MANEPNDNRMPKACLWIVVERTLLMVISTYGGREFNSREIPVPDSLKDYLEVRLWAKATALHFARINNVPDRLVFEINRDQFLKFR